MRATPFCEKTPAFIIVAVVDIISSTEAVVVIDSHHSHTKVCSRYGVETITDKFGPKGQPPGALALAVDPHAQDTRLAS